MRFIRHEIIEPPPRERAAGFSRADGMYQRINQRIINDYPPVVPTGGRERRREKLAAEAGGREKVASEDGGRD